MEAKSFGIQTDRIALPRVQVREIHYFNEACQIAEIIGFVHGSLICPPTVSNAVLQQLCTEESVEDIN